MNSLVDAQWLLEHRSDPTVRVVDLRWSLSGNGRAAYLEAHVPGAVFVDLESELSAPDDGREGRHPLPEPESFAAVMRRAGIGTETHVVVYDDAGGAVAARLWWMLRAASHELVSILDGGIEAWRQAGGALESGDVKVGAGDFVVQPIAQVTVTREELVTALAEGALLLDARAPERYRGENEPVDPRAGHIPGAVNLPSASLLSDGRFLRREQLRTKLEALVSPGRKVVASCGSGVTACHLIFAFDHSGVLPFPYAPLYVGSFSDWSRRSDRPVAVGPHVGVLS